jgi:hypothetical protein
MAACSVPEFFDEAQQAFVLVAREDGHQLSRRRHTVSISV